MTARERSCQTCRHFEPSALWRRGWCRNPRLYSPQQSHLVDQETLDCARGLGDAWEPMEGSAGNHPMPSGDERRPLMIFAPQPRLTGAAVAVESTAGAGAGMMASANVGGSGSGGGSGGGGGLGGSSGGVPPTGPNRPDRGPTPTGQERTISFQPEERYWTDYLRILLPVAGLLILIGLLWVWLNTIIGDPSESPPQTPTTNVAIQGDQTETVGAPPASPTPPATPAVPAANAGPPPTATVTPPPAQTPATESQPGVSAATEPTEAAAPDEAPPTVYETYAVGDTVVVTETGVNLRAEASTESDSLGVLTQGQELRITGNFVPFDPPLNDWWPVETAEGVRGFVREEFLERP